MQMEIKELSLREMERVYEERMAADFPPDELRPFRSIRELTEAGRYKSFGCFEGGLAAYGTFACLPGHPGVLLDYFAVDAGRRGQGIGSRGLRKLGEAAKGFGEGFLLIEVESLESAETPEQAQERARRIRFYKGCGCLETAVYSWLFGVEYRILVMPLGEGAPGEDGVQEALEQVYHTIVPPLVGESEEAYARVCRTFRRKA